LTDHGSTLHYNPNFQKARKHHLLPSWFRTTHAIHNLKTNFIKGGWGISEAMKGKSPHLFYVPDWIDPRGHYVCHKAFEKFTGIPNGYPLCIMRF
jgi:hypothetical protein